MALSKIVENSIADSAISASKLKDFAAAVDLNGVELVLDADADTSITADTDDRIDFKIANTDHISIGTSSGDTVIKAMVDAKDIKFQQFDGRTLLDINDGGFVGIENGATGPGVIRIFEDTDNGSNYVGLSVGNVSTAYTLVFPNADGSSGQALTTNGSGVLSFSTVSANTPTSADGQALGSASLEWSDLFLADASTIQFGNDQDVILTHVADTGLLLSGTNVIQFNDASQNIGAPSATVLDINATDEIELNATLIDVNGNLDVSGTIVGASTLSATTGTFSGILKTDDATEATTTTDGSLQTDGGLSVVKDAVFGDDVKFLSDAAVLRFGVNQEVTLTHSHNLGLNFKMGSTSDDKPFILTLQTGEADMQANDVIAAINFQAPDESTGTDAILVAAGIEAIAEGDFSASNNATKLSFKTGASEAASEKMSLSSAGLLTVADDIVFKDGGTIGVSSAVDAMTVSSAGIVTFKDDIKIKDGGTIGTASDADAITIAAAGNVTFSQGGIFTVADNSDTLRLISTDDDASTGPVINLVRDSGSPADADSIGRIYFSADNDAGEEENFVRFKASIIDASNGSEDGQLRISRMIGGGDQNVLSFLNAETVVNDDSKDLDFRVETDGNTHMLFVDGGNNHVSIGATTLEGGDVLAVIDSGSNTTNTRFINTNADAHGSKIIVQKSSASPADADEVAEILFMGKDDAGNDNAYANIQVFADDVSNSSEDGSIAFGVTTGGTFAERVRIVTNKVGFGTATPSAGLDIVRDDTLYRGTNASSTANFQNMRLFSAVGGAGTETFRIENDGDVKNTNNSYGSISDERIKQNITDAGSQWDDIKALKIRNYKRKDQVSAGLDITMIGVIAQELETAGMNGLVKESPPGTGEIRANSVFGTIEEVKSYYTELDIEVEKGTKSVGDVKETTYKENPSDVLVKGVKYSVLYMKAIKALQEAQTRIETLESKVQALEDA